MIQKPIWHLCSGCHIKGITLLWTLVIQERTPRKNSCHPRITILVFTNLMSNCAPELIIAHCWAFKSEEFWLLPLQISFYCSSAFWSRAIMQCVSSQQFGNPSNNRSHFELLQSAIFCPTESSNDNIYDKSELKTTIQMLRKNPI